MTNVAMQASADAGSRDGTQLIKRAAMILRLMTRRGAAGWRLSEITRISGLTHATCRRILRCLVEERLAHFDAATKRYRLGPLNYELGLASDFRLEFRDQLRPVMERVAVMSGDTVYLHIVSGIDTVCIERVDGTYPIRAVTLEVGGRRPLGFGAAGIALLAQMDDDEIAQIIKLLDREFVHNPRLTPDSVLQSLQAARRNGYGLMRDSTVLGVASIGIALSPPEGLPPIGVGLAMVAERMTSNRIRSLHRLLVDEFSSVNWRR
jgi:DNA-binding IclR family transcriptional regulator